MSDPEATRDGPADSKRELRSFPVPADQSGQRLDAFLAAHLQEEGVSRERIKKYIREASVMVDGKTITSPKTQVLADSVVAITLFATPTHLNPEPGDLPILYQDDCLAVINKPAGITVHPAPGLSEGTLAHRLLAHFPGLAAQEGMRPGIVHRLDKDTSGLMLVALDEATRLGLAEQFARHDIFKEYLAIVHRVPQEAEGIIDAPVGRDSSHKTKMAVVCHGKSAKSAWRVLYADPEGYFSLVAVRIFSGRTHQVRVHMRHIGHPLWGDSVYGYKEKNGQHGISRQMLHAWKLSFNHPFPHCMTRNASPEGLLSFICPPPHDFTDALKKLMRRMVRVVVTGSPGCGKSALLQVLQNRGIAVFSSDAEVARLYSAGGDGQRMLRAHFGDRFVPHENAPVDKAALAEAMRQSPSLRRELEGIIHPLVRHAVSAFWQKAEQAGAEMAVAEIPLYLESGWNTGNLEGVDSIVLHRTLLVGVHCPYESRTARLLEKRGWSQEQIAMMESWQWPEDKKMAACDLVLDNSGDLDALNHSATALMQDIRTETERKQNEELLTIQRLWMPDSNASS